MSYRKEREKRNAKREINDAIKDIAEMQDMDDLEVVFINPLHQLVNENENSRFELEIQKLKQFVTEVEPFNCERRPSNEIWKILYRNPKQTSESFKTKIKLILSSA